MPTLIHTMPLSKLWNGRPDPFGGVAYGMEIETSHVTVQGLKILGMPVVEHPKPGLIQRVYPIGRSGRDLDDLCIFYGLKQSVVVGGTTGHAMRNCLVYGAYGCGIWTTGIANDFDFRNNVIANSSFVWIGQSAASARAEAGQGPGRPGDGRPPAPPSAAPREPVHYRVVDSLFAGNKKLAGAGAGPALNFRDADPSFLELVRTKVSGEPVTLELDQTKRNYLHPVEGSEAAAVGAGLFTRTS